jgi:uncharacterized protein YaaR (DUF327 family)
LFQEAPGLGAVAPDRTGQGGVGASALLNSLTSQGGSRKGYRQVVIYLEAKVREFVEEFVIRISRMLNRPSPKVNVRSTGYYYVEVKSRKLYELLKKLIDLDKIRKFVEHCEKCSRSVS